MSDFAAYLESVKADDVAIFDELPDGGFTALVRTGSTGTEVVEVGPAGEVVICRRCESLAEALDWLAREESFIAQRPVGVWLDRLVSSIVSQLEQAEVVA